MSNVETVVAGKPTQYMVLADAMREKGPLTRAAIGAILGDENPIVKNFSVYANLVKQHGGHIRAVREDGRLTYELTKMPVPSRRGREPGTVVGPRKKVDAAPQPMKTIEEVVSIVIPAGRNSETVVTTAPPPEVVAEPVKVVQPERVPETNLRLSFAERMRLAKANRAKEREAAIAIRQGVTTAIENVPDSKLIEAFAS